MSQRPKRTIKPVARYEPDVSSLEDDESVDEDWDNSEVSDSEIIQEHDSEESGDDDDSYESDFVAKDDAIEYETGASEDDEDDDDDDEDDETYEDDSSDDSDEDDISSEEEDEKPKKSKQKKESKFALKIKEDERSESNIESLISCYNEFCTINEGNQGLTFFNAVGYDLQLKTMLRILQLNEKECFTENELLIVYPLLTEYFKAKNLNKNDYIPSLQISIEKH